MTSEMEDATPKVTQSEPEGDIHGGSFGADDIVANSEAFQALKTAYTHMKNNYHSVNEKNIALKLEVKKLLKENEKLKQISESGERSNSFDISPEAADKNKMYLLQTNIEELKADKYRLQLLLQSYQQSNDLPGNEQLTEIQCQNKNCKKRVESLEKLNKELMFDTKQQESVIQRLQQQLNNLNTTDKSEDPDMETDGIDSPKATTDLVEYDIGSFLGEYKLLKVEVSKLLSEVNEYRKLNQHGMLLLKKRKPEESDFEMEDYEEKRKAVAESVLDDLMQTSSGIKRPPKEELGISNLRQTSPTLNDSDEDLYGASTSTKYSPGSDRAMTGFEESNPTTKNISSSYGPVSNVPTMQHKMYFQPGSAPAFPTSGRRASPRALLHGQNSPHRSGSFQVSNQGSDLRFRIPIMQETGEDLLPPRNPPNIKDDVHFGGRNSPDFFTPATSEERQREETEDENTAMKPTFTSCPICSRQFDTSLFSAEYINHHVNSHFDGSSEYEFVDILS